MNFLRIAPDRQKVFFIDETGFQVNMICRYGRELTGVRATRVVPTLRSRNYSVACTMSCEGMVNFKIRERAYNAECFLEYLLEIFEIFQAREISEVYLVMDNVPFHKTALVQNTIRAFNHVPIYLPPYSPFLNPIENLFSKWKGLVRQANSRTADELFSSIEASSTNITSNDCPGFYRHMESYLPDCIQGCPVEN
ncbi:hypothetical protein RF11_09007 [Thelohanellus kitauei]|uniref:Tc1-like transposase DDE domain-containing protein n=1 Tax=Thelohanellus kitauei TaxID=669202 RepID=A0A0C2M715_THEKT|nr:hypothetical protein RF11_09007 [Thelohanellus kitauei]